MKVDTEYVVLGRTEFRNLVTKTVEEEHQRKLEERNMILLKFVQESILEMVKGGCRECDLKIHSNQYKTKFSSFEVQNAVKSMGYSAYIRDGIGGDVVDIIIS